MSIFYLRRNNCPALSAVTGPMAEVAPAAPFGKKLKDQPADWSFFGSKAAFFFRFPVWLPGK
jgi:hypothetical protein